MANLPYPADPNTLPALTPKQMEFVRGIARGLNASDAYRQAYDTHAKPEVIWVNGHKTRYNAKVSQWIDALDQAHYFDAFCSREGHLMELQRLKGVAEGKDKINGAIKCEELRGRVAGHYVERLEKTHRYEVSEAFLQALRSFPRPMRVVHEVGDDG